ncbi:TlpA family protein disulfide reductase [sulfur-oxidizing endosymbiont of Gigantopelta aegis]|uniref:TlpA family protein disulfide reductase n=1 Tax=sulfur-oxidizing endosymbiont of Gigantopelta aegis TaxID=2794934 RepID=UPI0018DC7D71|nr:redoxin domain-containing protein [sulfur-oxidizing endosymbiont of Gigantopelta aegis]
MLYKNMPYKNMPYKNIYYKKFLFFMLGIFMMNASFAMGNSLVSSESLREFTKDSYQEILQTNKGQPFLMVLWSIDCPPCHEELAHISAYKKKYPKHKIILISTDSNAQAVRQVLEGNDVLHLESWLFSNALAHQLRYAIDPHWYGELPRSYFFSQQHTRQAVSGTLSLTAINAFFSRSY